jgi:glycosyltransferase involved in cell wall biosynthesis
MSATQRDATISVSIIIPVFNDQGGVENCLRAIAEQAYPLHAIEVIIVDNGSVPPLAVPIAYPFDLRMLRCSTPGSYAARNAGVKAASGEVLAFIDADCWPSKNWLDRGVKSLMRGRGESIVGGEVSIVKPERLTAVALYQCATGFGQAANVHDKGFAATANLFCTRAQFDAGGWFDERLLSGGDREWCWRAATRGIRVHYEPEAAIYTLPRSSLRSAMQQARRVVAGRAMLRKLGLAHLGDVAVAKQRSAWQSVKWILWNRDLSVWDRVQVLCTAVLIRGAAVLESWRLALGAKPERR